MVTPHPFDALGVDGLIARQSMKWTKFPGTLPAWVAEMDYPVAEPIRAALRKGIELEQFGYLPEPLAQEMKEVTSDYLARHYHWPISPERIFPTGDVLAAYEQVIRLLVTPGSPLVIPTPAYMPFLSLAKLLGHPVIEVPMLDLDGPRPRLDLEAIGQALAGPAELVVLCNPHNPLGIVHTRDELLALSHVVEAHSGLVFADEIHAPLVFGGAVHVPYASISDVAADHSVTATSASKAWNLPGLKCAQLIVSSDSHRETLEPYAFTISHGAATPGVLATIAAYQQGDAWLTMAKDYIEANLEAIAEFCDDHLPGAHYRKPQGTYITWLDARAVAIGQADSAAAYFRDHAGIALTDGASCGEAGVGHLRMIAATTSDILGQILQRLDAHWVLRD